MTDLLHLVAVGLYALTAAMLGISFARPHRRLPGVATATLALAVVAHGAALVAYARRFGEPPLVGLAPSLSVLGFLIALGSLGVATLGRTGPLGLVLVPVAAAVAAAAQAAGVRPGGEAGEFRGLWLVFHVVLAMLGYAALAVAFAAGLMYLLQFRELKSRRFGAIFRFFPPLDTLDRIGRRALMAGLPLLTAALLLGWAWTERFHQPFAVGNPKVVWGVISWLAFAAALGARAAGNTQARRGALASVLGFAVVVISYLVLRVGGVGSTGGFL
jgi:ABC-type transport system involved in cytochrome c biogenesis permease subunit